jgi:hypothetical protein
VASRDFASVVRKRAAEVAGGFYKRTGSGAFLSLIRLFLRDPDALVRSGASELLSTLPSQKKPVLNEVSEKAQTESPKPADLKPAGVPASGQIRLIGDGSVRVQIDRGSPQALSNKPVTVTAGKHRISWVGGAQDVEVGAGETATLTVPVTYAEQLLHDGIEAYQAKRLSRAQEFFERIKLLEQRGSVKKTLLPDLAYYLGRIYEDQQELAKALQEYGRLRALLNQQSRPELRAGLDKAMARLNSVIGHIILSRRDQAGRCIVVDIYLPPGTHSIDLGLGKSEPVRAQAGVTTTINKCP